MFRIKFILILCIMIFSFTSCSPSKTKRENASGYHKINAKQAKDMMDKKKVIVVDVRTAEEYKQGHIKEAINIPNESILSQQPEQLADKNAVLLVYCRTGVRSRDASEKLTGMGYKNVFDFGGIADWPYEVISGGE